MNMVWPLLFHGSSSFITMLLCCQTITGRNLYQAACARILTGSMLKRGKEERPECSL